MVLIYDTECNSLDTEKGFIQELAWAIYDPKTWRCLKAKSHLLKWGREYEIEPDALAVTGLTREYCEQNGEPPYAIFTDFLFDLSNVEFLCGHNAVSFDRPMVLNNLRKSVFCKDCPDFNKIHIDTLLDCEFPPQMKVKSLKYLALDHGYVHFGAHQALSDVQACAHVLSKYDFARVVEISKTPVVKIRSKIDWSDLVRREKVKQARFYWNKDLKVWEKSIREFFLPEVQLSLGDLEVQCERPGPDPKIEVSQPDPLSPQQPFPDLQTKPIPPPGG